MLPQNWVGKTIGGRYQIESIIGQGGMSAVYKANDPNLRRVVAIKLIHSHLSVNPNFVNRFKEEAAAVARLRHPNIVQVHDFNIDDDTYYMVMEYLVGETLQARLRRLTAAHRFLPYTDLIQFCIQLCDAIGYAHNHELIHRDIKPANIMLDLNGQAILMDFGIVKIVGGDYHTATGATIGTAMYMSPEQIRSERVDERSDIYSLGVTLYEMISGQTPYQADSAITLMMMVLNDPLPDLREIRKEIPENLLRVVEKALAKDPSERFQTMDEMAAALRMAQEQLESTPSVATVVDDDELVQTLPLELPPEEHEKVQDSPKEPKLAEASLPEQQDVKYSQRDIQRVEEGVSSIPTMKEAPIQPDIAPLPSAPSKIRGTPKLGSKRIIAAIVALLVLGAASVVSIYFINAQKAPDLQLAPINHPSNPINAQTAQLVVSLGRWETGSYIENLAYSPVDSLVGTANNRDWVRFSKYGFYGGLWQVDTGSLQNYFLGHTSWIYGVVFSPDGRLFATASDDSSVIVWQVSDGSQVRKIEGSMGGFTNVDFSPNNLLLAAGSWDGVVGLWQLSDGNLLRTLQGNQSGVRDVEFSPDGKLLASALEDNTIIVWQVSDGSMLHTLQGHTAQIYNLAFSPDGTLLASASEDKTIGIWQISDGSLINMLQGHSEAVSDVAFSPDGSLLASGSLDATLRLWRLTDGEMLRLLSEDSESIKSVVFSPDGHLLVSAAADGSIRFWGLSEAIPLETEAPAN